MLEQIKQLIEDQRKTLKLFALGALLFFIGVGIIQWADKLMEPSLEQEAYALLGLFVGGLGFCTSITAQIFLIIHRFNKLNKSD